MDLVVRRVDLWLARRELTALIRNRRTYMVDQVSKCIGLLRSHPELAQERFRCGTDPAFERYVFPIYYLVIAGADADILQEAHAMYPPALAQKVMGNLNKIDYPLHIACGGFRPNEDAIRFIANACPAVVRISNSINFLPIHVLLRNSHHSPSKKILETLLDLYESSGVGKDYRQDRISFLHGNEPTLMDLLGSTACGRDEIRCLREPLALAIKHPNVKKDALELLVKRYPKDCKSLCLGRLQREKQRGNMVYLLGEETNYSISKEHVAAIAELLPRLEVLCCPAKTWVDGAFQQLMKQLSSETCALRELTLRMHAYLLRCAEQDHAALEQYLTHDTTLERLHIDFYHDKYNVVYNVCQLPERIVAAVLKALRHNQTLQSLCLTGVSWQDETKTEKLYDKHLWPGLAKVLQEGNVTLSRIGVEEGYSSRSVWPSSPSRRRAEYLVDLNRLGRARFRDPTLGGCGLLALLDPVIDRGRVDLLFGLLRENPSVWLE